MKLLTFALCNFNCLVPYIVQAQGRPRGQRVAQWPDPQYSGRLCFLIIHEIAGI